ncbi:glycosyltransferase [Patescibacteria group bacterium]|nr:glycosyltransferase [Patescibacteria group bacterium]
MTLALQLVTYHSSSHLERLFASLRAQTVRDWTLHVRDHSEDPAEIAQVQASLEKSGLSFTFEVGKNIGFASGHNALFAKHEASFIALVNPDIDVEPEYYERLLQVLKTHPELAAVQGALLRGARGSVTVDSLGLLPLGMGDIRDLGAGERLSAWETRLSVGLLPVFGVSGAAPLFRRTSLDAVASERAPFLDERFFMYKEDVELGIRLHRAGFAAMCVPSARGYHLRTLGRTTFWERVKDEFRRSPHVRVSSYANQWKIYFLHGEARHSMSGWGRTLFAEMNRSVALCLSPKLFLQAWRNIQNDRRSLLASRREYRVRFPKRWFV